MKAIAFYLLAPLIFFISVLPFRVLHLLSDILFPVLYHLVRYRRKVVIENLRNSFPEKMPDEIEEIAKGFYRHFMDLVFEIIKMRTASPERISKRIHYSNPELLQKYFDGGKSVLALSAHLNCWEWTPVCARYTPHFPVVIYKQLHNKYFDRFMKKARERYGIETIPMRETLRRVRQDRKNGHLVLYGLVSDQSPVWEETQHWTGFMNQLTAVYTGPEKLALKTGYPVVFYSMRKIGRGRYIIDLIPVSEDHSGKKEHEITQRFFELLENRIRENPEHYLWTHRRWKLTSRKLAEMKNSEVEKTPSITSGPIEDGN
jgi:KDO2-lipid IV(A) lauroyltransferase